MYPTRWMRILRIKHKITHKQLAAAAHVSRQRIVEIELGSSYTTEYQRERAADLSPPRAAGSYELPLASGKNYFMRVGANPSYLSACRNVAQRQPAFLWTPTPQKARRVGHRREFLRRFYWRERGYLQIIRQDKWADLPPKETIKSPRLFGCGERGDKLAARAQNHHVSRLAAQK